MKTILPLQSGKQNPGLCLKCAADRRKTELFFFFRYGNSDIAYQNQTFWLPPEDPEGAGVLVIRKRDREKESQLVKEVVTALRTISPSRRVITPGL